MRVSTLDQNTDSQAPELKRWADSRGQPFEWHQDQFTGSMMNRPAWNQIAANMQAGDSIVIWRLDRLGRTASGLTALFDDLIARRINLVSIRDGIDLSTAAGRLIANILASVAQFETEVRRERIAAGIAAAKAKGRRWGGSPKGRQMSTRATVEQQQAIAEMRGKGVKIAAIARATGLSRQTVYQYLPAP